MNTIPSNVITELKRNEIILTWSSVHRPGFTYTLSMEPKVCDMVLLIIREIIKAPFNQKGIFLRFHIPAKSLIFSNILSLSADDLSHFLKTHVTAECKKDRQFSCASLFSDFHMNTEEGLSFYVPEDAYEIVQDLFSLSG